MSDHTPAAAVALTDDELELVVVALAEGAAAQRKFAGEMRRLGNNKAAEAALGDMVRTVKLQNRLALEHMDRPPRSSTPPASTLAELATCPECGARGDKHESDCDMRPVQP